MSYLKIFRSVALLEGISFLLLAVTMVFKYGYGIKQPNYIVGMAHGVLFIGYMGLLCIVIYKRKLQFKDFVIGFLASLVPFGTFYADKRFFSKW